VDLIPSPPILSCSLHSRLDPVTLALGDSLFKARHGKEAWEDARGCHRWSAPLSGALTSCSEWGASDVIASLSCTPEGVPLAVLDVCFVRGEGGGFLSRKSLIFAKEPPWAPSGSVKVGVINWIVPARSLPKWQIFVCSSIRSSVDE